MKIKAIKAEVIERIKSEWQEHNRDYGLTWNEVATLVNQVSRHHTQTSRPSVEEANKIVEENFKGLNDLIEDADFLQFYKSLISDCMVDFATQHHTPISRPSEEESKEDFLDWLQWKDKLPEEEDPDYYTVTWGMNVWNNAMKFYNK